MWQEAFAIPWEGSHGALGSWAVPALIQEHWFRVVASQEDSRMPFPGSCLDSVVLEDFSNLQLCGSKMNTGDVHSLPSPFCLTVSETG